uniref:Uncharacterized protein n=1 Tax=Anguilla anguilla TaxID=7936 RepID=A0A0E9PUS7_ANGAN
MLTAFSTTTFLYSDGFAYAAHVGYIIYLQPLCIAHTNHSLQVNINR